MVVLDGILSPRLARRMPGGKLTLGALLARPGEQKRDIAAAAGAARERIAELTELLDFGGPGYVAGSRVTVKPRASSRRRWLRFRRSGSMRAS